MRMKVFANSILVVLLLLMIGYAMAGTETFTVPANQEVKRTLGLSEGDKVSGSILVSGAAGDDINFYVTDPNGNTISRSDRATSTSFSFTASTTGTYTMCFDNTFPPFSNKSVTLDYEISKAIFGLAPELFLLLVIIAIIVIVVIAAFGLMRRKPASQPPKVKQ